MLYDIEGIKKILPHRDPFLLVTTVESAVPGKEIETTFYVDPAMDLFRGHFPDDPMLPGVYCVEILGQSCDIMFMLDPRYAGKYPLLLGANNFRFMRKIRPGDTVVVKDRLLSERPGKAICAAYCEAYVDGELCVSGEITLAMR